MVSWPADVDLLARRFPRFFGRNIGSGFAKRWRARSRLRAKRVMRVISEATTHVHVLRRHANRASLQCQRRGDPARRKNRVNESTKTAPVST
jgi:hypothetical protein